ncbi:MAG: D-glycero-beta-D-manno-heptose-7-phosphate kinase [Selenomonadaceae bacterium]|nr:D-glycero-beta-D-manno-heptose-7-phosphate kinase [Selenomonadaceae bacterium]MDD6120517.1 D-glycero-beta-D-manno-heptose-7-phosphate kinase [Selenomonadaceae bacterium]
MDKQKLYDFTATRTARCKILVVGDVMLDKYYYGEVTRISPEAPVPITHVTGSKETLGGAANVAHNLALLGCQTSIAGFVGEDYHCQSLMDKFTARGIDYKGLITTDRPTTTKMRIMGGHQQMLRLDFEDAHDVSGPYADRLRNYVNQKLNESLDCLVLSDYGKGTLTEETSQLLIKAAHAHGVPVVIDPKGMNWTKYAHADYITPNLKEINQVLLEPIANEDTAVERAAHYVMRKYKLANIVATRSEEGLSFVNDQQSIHIPTKAQEVFDVSGAGDTVIAVFAMALAGGLNPVAGAYMANLAASVVVAKLGTYAVSREELLDVLK